MRTAKAIRRMRLAIPIAPAISNGPASLTGGKIWRLREPGAHRTYTIIRFDTRGGLSGYGEAGNVTDAEFQTALAALQGREATAYEVIAAPPALRGAVNMALLDLVGKLAKAPVYQVLGGPTRHKARALASVDGPAGIAAAQSAGFRAFSVPLPAPPFPNSGRAYVDQVLAFWKDLQSKGGANASFVLDGAMRLTPGDAQVIAAAVERLHPLWLDEPCRITNLRALAKISEESVAPLGFGREIDDLAAFQDLLREQAIDVLRLNLTRLGISASRRAAVLAEPYYTAVAPYHDGGPLGTAAGLHLAASVPNFVALQTPAPAGAGRQARTDLLSGWAETVRDGFFELPTGPGLGVQVDEKVLTRLEVKA